MSVENGERPVFRLDAKRLHLPGVVVCDKCPGCGEEKRYDLSYHEYLSTPLVNEPFEEGLYCDSCGHEWTVRLRLVLRLEVA